MRLELHDFPEADALWNRFVLHAIEAVIAKAGGRITHATQPRDVLRGDPHTEFEVMWS